MNLVIANIQVRQDDAGRYLLNDLHRAAGQIPKHKPSEWLRNQQTKELIDEISIAGIPAIETKPKVGTFGCKELIYAYAMWISPSFHLKVIRAYDQMQQQPSVMPGQVERVAMGDPITPEELAAVLARPVIISASEYLSLTQGKSSGNQIAEHSQAIKQLTPQQNRKNKPVGARCSRPGGYK